MLGQFIMRTLFLSKSSLKTHILCVKIFVFIYIFSLATADVSSSEAIERDEIILPRNIKGFPFPLVSYMNRLYNRISAMKRSMALGRLEFRPGKRSEISESDYPKIIAIENLFRPTRKSMYTTVEELESLPSSFSLLTETQMGKRSMAVGRSGFRPGKRLMTSGRVGYRPGKRDY